MADTADVDIESFTLTGDGVARLGRTPLTVPFTIPGERVRVRLGATRAGVTSASLLEILRSSPIACAPRCRHFGPEAEGGRTCGGCSWQHIAYAEQLALKTDSGHAPGSRDSPAAPAARAMLAGDATDAPWRYRHKVHFVIERGRSGELVMGHYARFSRRVVGVRECPVHDERGNAVAFGLRDACQWADTQEVKSIAVRAGCTRSETMATIVVASEKDKRIRAASRRALAGNPRRRHFTSTFTRAEMPSFSAGRHVTSPDLSAFARIWVAPRFWCRRRHSFRPTCAPPRSSCNTFSPRYQRAHPSSISMPARGSSRCRSRSGVTRSSPSKRTAAQWPMAKPACASAACRRRDAGSWRNRSKSLLLRAAFTSQDFDALVLDPPREGCQPSVIDLACGSAARRGSCMCPAIRNLWRAISRASPARLRDRLDAARGHVSCTRRTSRRSWC